jgi:hypothetical protein
MFCTSRYIQSVRVRAAFALVASAVVAFLVATGFIPDVKFDFSQWGEFNVSQGGEIDYSQQGEEQHMAVLARVFCDCLKGESLLYTTVAAGLGEAYTNLKPSIDALSYARPVIAVLYLLIAARFFMAAVDRRKPIVFCSVLLAAVIATGVNWASLFGYLNWSAENSSCQKTLAEVGLNVQPSRC